LSFLVFGWVKNEFASQPVAEIDRPFEMMEAILGTLMIETITDIDGA
jgi:hypothetical protein